MSRADTLRSLEIVIESFLDRAVEHKESRIEVLGGLNRLDDLARACREPEAAQTPDLADRVGSWMAEHRDWLESPSLRPGDRHRLGGILEHIRNDLKPATDSPPATRKIVTEVDRWRARLKQPTPDSAPRPDAARKPKLVLRRGPETLDPKTVHPSSGDAISVFGEVLKSLGGLYGELAVDRKHLMSILDDTLKSATLQKNQEALLLSATIIYYLKLNGYMVRPFVKRLREAERLQSGDRAHA